MVYASRGLNGKSQIGRVTTTSVDDVLPLIAWLINRLARHHAAQCVHCANDQTQLFAWIDDQADRAERNFQLDDLP